MIVSMDSVRDPHQGERALVLCLAATRASNQDRLARPKLRQPKPVDSHGVLPLGARITDPDDIPRRIRGHQHAGRTVGKQQHNGRDRSCTGCLRQAKQLPPDKPARLGHEALVTKPLHQRRRRWHRIASIQVEIVAVQFEAVMAGHGCNGQKPHLRRIDLWMRAADRAWSNFRVALAGLRCVHVSHSSCNSGHRARLLR
jgi:hypothetical protein